MDHMATRRTSAQQPSKLPLGLLIRWQFSPYVGIELSYNNLGEFPGPAYTDFDLTEVTAAVTGHLPLSENISLFAKAGQIRGSADSSLFFFQ